MNRKREGKRNKKGKRVIKKGEKETIKEHRNMENTIGIWKGGTRKKKQKREMSKKDKVHGKQNGRKEQEKRMKTWKNETDTEKGNNKKEGKELAK